MPHRQALARTPSGSALEKPATIALICRVVLVVGRGASGPRSARGLPAGRGAFAGAEQISGPPPWSRRPHRPRHPRSVWTARLASLLKSRLSATGRLETLICSFGGPLKALTSLDTTAVMGPTYFHAPSVGRRSPRGSAWRTRHFLTSTAFDS
jgi:hypothetical protein